MNDNILKDVFQKPFAENNETEAISDEAKHGNLNLDTLIHKTSQHHYTNQNYITTRYN